MAYPEHQRWALALSAVITELNGGHHDALGGWGENEHTRAWCKNHLAKFYGIASQADLASMAKWLYQEGHTKDARALLSSAAQAGASEERDAETDARARVVLDNREEIEKRGVLAWDTARLVAVLGWSAWAGYIGEIPAWEVMLMAGARAQQTYDSWESFARGYELGRLFWAEGAPHEPTARAIEKLTTDPASPWKTLAWNFDLGVKILDPNAKTRFKKTTCAACGAAKSRPSATAYVYCDFCGALADYDFQRACATPIARPGPVYEALAAALAPKIEAARASGDREAFRAAQIELFDAFARACPDATPLRARDEAYRAKYAAYLAEGALVTAFDDRARELDAAMRDAMSKLRGEKLDTGEIRLNPNAWRALFEAVLAREAHAAALFESAGVYAMQPDGASAALQKRMSMSMFAQGWLPMLDETTAKDMLTRLGLVGDFVEGTSGKEEIAKGSCGACGAELAVARGARRMICEQCGRKIDVEGARVTCSGCGASLSPAEGVDAFACPYCKIELRRVAAIRA